MTELKFTEPTAPEPPKIGVEVVEIEQFMEHPVWKAVIARALFKNQQLWNKFQSAFRVGKYAEAHTLSGRMEELTWFAGIPNVFISEIKAREEKSKADQEKKST